MLTPLALFFSPEAAACGGFFCNNLDPVEQAGEQIVFEVDPEAGDAGQTTMHVQVTYEGPPIEFAWVVPVKGVPDLFVSSDVLFSTLDMFTRPQFFINWEAEGECLLWDVMLADADGPPVPESSGGVSVLDASKVGPYETVVVAADDETALIDWLQANDYNIPSGMSDVLAPYVADGHNFVALRLAAGNDTGDLVPLGLRYEGTVPAIPIQLTSVAATPDMQLVTYVLGPSRAVPDNYLHVELNEAAINWFTGGSNYLDVLSRAADEAGGHAFATEYAGATADFPMEFYSESWEDLDFASAETPTAFLEMLIGSGIPASSTLLELLETYVPVPDGYTSIDVYNCPSCFPGIDALMADGFDPVGAAAAIDEQIVQPLAAIQAMFDRAEWITRLGSTVSPAEMTIDPMFTFNETIEQEVSNIHQARLVYLCEELEEGEDAWYSAPKLLIVGDMEIRVPSVEDLEAHGLTEADFLEQIVQPAASTIADTGPEGEPELLYDARVDIEAALAELDDSADTIEGRRGFLGCSTAPAGGLLWGLFGMLAVAGRRRRGR